MSDAVADPPEEFVDLVRDALLHLYDAPHLQTHALVKLSGIEESGSAASGRLLRQALLDAVEEMRPGPGVSAGSRAWRSYRILGLRYIEGFEVDDVMKEVFLSSRQYYREHNRVLQAVASILWRRWRLSDRWGSRGKDRVAEESGGDDPARLEAEHLLREDQPRLIDPAEVLQGVCQLLRPLCTQRDVELELQMTAELPPLWGNRVALRQALVSILARAVDASDQGKVLVAAGEHAGRLQLHVSGFTASRVDVRRLGEESRPFVEGLGGSIDYERPPIQEGCWTIRLSFEKADRPLVLVVDNDQGFIRLVERYLAGDQWEVIGASCAEQALALASERKPRVILLDVVIPGRDGWELLQALKATPPTHGIPVLICSVLDEPSVGLSLGAAAYLHKPVDQCQLVAALQAYL